MNYGIEWNIGYTLIVVFDYTEYLQYLYRDYFCLKGEINGELN